MTVRSSLASAVELFQATAVPSPRHDAEEIASHLLDVPRSELWRHLDRPEPSGFTTLVERRAQRVPLQHLTGVAYFRHETLRVGPGVFVPRPETEIVVDAALRLLATAPQVAPVVVDLGSGSGAIARSIVTERGDAVVHAVEVDPGSVPWLRLNLQASTVAVHEEDMADCLPALAGCVDLVVSNPPYIPVGAVPRDPEVARFDPASALYSGPDGLDHIRVVERTAARLLRPDGWVVVEHADTQGTTAPAVFGKSGWYHVSDHPDLAGRDRFLVAQRAADPRESSGTAGR